jgi:hypothetical protein
MTNRTRRLCRAFVICIVVWGAGVTTSRHDSLVLAQSPLDFAFYKENVEPLFVRPRGNFRPPTPGEPACVMCHTWQANTPLKLERLMEKPDGSVYWTEEQSRKNFEVVSRLVVPGDPENSRLLRKPLAVEAGGADAHVGGKFWKSRDDPEWKVMAEWVRTGKASTSASAAARTVDFEFFRSCVQPILVKPMQGAVSCTECHAGGNGGFAKPIPTGRDAWNDAEARAAYQAVMRFVAPGYPTQSRFLMHPLHPNGGGDYAHNGVKRWTTQKDPEWQMLAAWVRGERTGTSCQ